MSEINNSNNSNNSEKEDNLNQTNDEFTQKIFELELVIKEKEEIIYTLHTKIKEFGNNIEQLKLENERLKSQIMLIEEEINNNKSLFNNNILQMQKTQRFQVNKEIIDNNKSNNSLNNKKINYDYLNENSNQLINDLNNYEDSFNLYNSIQNEFINENFKSKIIPFKMKPFITFDHSKLDINNNINSNDIKKENKIFNDNNSISIINDKNNNITNQIKDNISLLERDFMNNNQSYNTDKIFNNNICKLYNNNCIKYNKNKAGIKLHSSMFFQNCKNIISKKEYKKLLEIVKLSNLKKISKEDTYLKITSLLDDNYPELSSEFKLLFV